MKKSFVCSLFFALGFCCVLSATASAQTTSPGVSEKKFEELISEVRQLRLEVQRLSASAQVTQILLEQWRSQQEVVTRLTQKLAETRNGLVSNRNGQMNLRQILENEEKRKELGLTDETKVKGMKEELNALSQHEQVLVDQELQLSSETRAERSNLNDLKTRLDKLVQELAVPSSEPAKKRE